jgi:hypothetical protein
VTQHPSSASLVEEERVCHQHRPHRYLRERERVGREREREREREDRERERERERDDRE